MRFLKLLYSAIFILSILIVFTSFIVPIKSRIQFRKKAIKESSLISKRETIFIPAIEAKKITAEDIIYPFPKPELKKIEPLKFNLNNHFTSSEINHIGAKNQNLFNDRKQVILDLSLYDKVDFVFPLSNAKLLSGYKTKRRPNHSGLDLKTFAGDTIRSAFDGIVRFSKSYAAYGRVIVVRHYNGLESVYSHNSKNLVKPGDVVKAGAPIALTGRTGRATTEHLHFEMRINGEHFNPEIIIDLKTFSLKKTSLVFTQRKSGRFSITPLVAPPMIL